MPVYRPTALLTPKLARFPVAPGTPGRCPGSVRATLQKK
jgi:hypothetical protein